MKKNTYLAWSQPKRNAYSQFAVVVPEDMRLYIADRVTSLILAKLYDDNDTYTTLRYDSLYDLDQLLDYDEDCEHNLVVSQKTIQTLLTLIEEELCRINKQLARRPEFRLFVVDAVASLNVFKHNLLNAIRVHELEPPVLLLPFRVQFMRVSRV